MEYYWLKDTFLRFCLSETSSKSFPKVTGVVVAVVAHLNSLASVLTSCVFFSTITLFLMLVNSIN